MVWAPNGYGAVVNPKAISEAAKYLQSRFPALQGAVLQSVHVCHYANTPSGDFLVDRHPRLDNVWFVGGGSGHGFKHGPAIAISST